MDKNFIVTSLEFDELEISLKDKIDKFLIDKLGSFAARQCESKVEYVEYIDEDVKCFKDTFRCELFVEIEFKPYKYKNEKMSEERVESVGAVFEYKGMQPFYIDGKFISMNVFEWTQGMIVQKHDKIFGINKDKIYEMIQDVVMDC